MPIAYVQEFDITSGNRTTQNYDAIAGRLREVDPHPPGLILHTAGFTPDDVFRIFSVWESQQTFERFRDEQLMPALEAYVPTGDTSPPDREYVYELHDVQHGA